MEEQAKQQQARWQKNKLSLIIATVIIIVLLIAFALAVYRFSWDWTGFNSGYSKVTNEYTPTGQLTKTIQEHQPGKTLWDLLQLLFIPVVLAIGGYLFNLALKRSEQESVRDSQREVALQNYIDKISELLLEKRLRESQPENEVRRIARIRTLTVLHPLDGMRKRSVLQFLYESGLIYKGGSNPIVDLSGANFRNADLKWIDLKGADLRGVLCRKADFTEAKLKGVDLRGARFRKAIFSKADLRGADLRWAYLFEADLTGADLTGAHLYEVGLNGANLKGAISISIKELEKQAKSLQGATMPDGSIHP